MATKAPSHRPDATDRGERGLAPFRLSEKDGPARQDEERHEEVDHDDNDERQSCERDRGRYSLGRPWSASGGSNVLAVLPARARQDPPPRSRAERPAP